MQGNLYCIECNCKERSSRRSIASGFYERRKERSSRRSIASGFYERRKERSSRRSIASGFYERRKERSKASAAEQASVALWSTLVLGGSDIVSIRKFSSNKSHPPPHCKYYPSSALIPDYLVA
jgi:hypothetical protein